MLTWLQHLSVRSVLLGKRKPMRSIKQAISDCGPCGAEKSSADKAMRCACPFPSSATSTSSKCWSKPLLSARLPACPDVGNPSPKTKTPRSLARVLCTIAESPYSAGIQVLSGLYSDMAAAAFAVSGPRSF